MEARLPAVITIVKGDKEPRLPSLRGMMKAKRAEIHKLTSADLPVDESKIGLAGSPTQVRKIFTPEKRKGGVVWEGEPAELAEKLVSEIEGII